MKTEDWQKLRNKIIFVTGITGIVGSAVKKVLLQANEEFNLNLKILGLVHRTTLESNSEIKVVKGSVENFPPITDDIDFIIHCAAETSSLEFIENPAGVIENSYEGIKNLLNLAREKHVKGFVLFSSMEVYGYPQKGTCPKETDVSSFNPEIARNSYPISKLMSEALCCNYATQFGVPTRIVRLTQTFGEGIKQSDKRVFAEFARCAKYGNNIVLKTDGLTERSYLYSKDAATAIITVLLNGKDGEIYNAANPDTYCSIKEFAQSFANNSEYNIKIISEPKDCKEYCKTLYMNIDISKLLSLSWKPETDLNEMIREAIKSV